MFSLEEVGMFCLKEVWVLVLWLEEMNLDWRMVELENDCVQEDSWS